MNPKIDPDNPLMFYYEDDSKAKADRERNRKRFFWFVGVPLTGLAALLASIIVDAPIFFPCWGVFAILWWAAIGGDDENKI